MRVSFHVKSNYTGHRIHKSWYKSINNGLDHSVDCKKCECVSKNIHNDWDESVNNSHKNDVACLNFNGTGNKFQDSLTGGDINSHHNCVTSSMVLITEFVMKKSEEPTWFRHALWLS